MATLVSGGVDFLILELFRHVTELEWAIEVALETGLTVGAMLCICDICSCLGPPMTCFAQGRRVTARASAWSTALSGSQGPGLT